MFIELESCELILILFIGLGKRGYLLRDDTRISFIPFWHIWNESKTKNCTIRLICGECLNISFDIISYLLEPCGGISTERTVLFFIGLKCVSGERCCPWASYLTTLSFFYVL